MSQKYVYLFTEGNGSMRELLGGKGANLAEMTNIGLPVPQGFTVTTEACTRYYDDGRKIKHLAYLDCNVVMEYDNGIPQSACDHIRELFAREEVLVEKKSKNGAIADQNIIPMIQKLEVQEQGSEITIRTLICCQNPSLNPMQIYHAICKYLPDLTPAFVRCERLEVYDLEKNTFR